MANKKTIKMLINVVVICGCFMASLDTSVVNLAISDMMSAFGSSVSQVQWVLSGYTLSMGLVVAISGYLCDKFGKRKVFTVALIIFTLGSLLCGLSWSTVSIVAFRVFQGLGGGLILPVSMIILMDSYESAERTSAVAVFGIAALVAPAIGPTLGGYIIQCLNWRYVFFINLPIGIIGIILSVIVLDDKVKENLKSFDFVGFLTCSVGISLILYVCGKNDTNWSDISTIIIIAIGCFSVLMFIVNEFMVSNPMLDLRILTKNYVFCMSNILLCVSLFALFGGVFLVPIFLQKIKQLTPIQAGLILFPEAFAQGISLVLSTKLSNKISGRVIAIFALILIGINGYGMSKLTLNTSNDTITLLLLIRGFGVGALMGPIQLLALTSVPQEQNSDASAILNTIKQLGIAIGITIISRIMVTRSAVDYSGMAHNVNANTLKNVSYLLIKNGVPASKAKIEAFAKIYTWVVRTSSVSGVNDTMLIISIISFISIIPAFFLSKKKENKSLVSK